MAKDRDAVSIGFWAVAIIITALPCIGTLFALIFAFVGENDSRKNFFKATLLLQLLVLFLLAALHALGFGAALYKALQPPQ